MLSKIIRNSETGMIDQVSVGNRLLKRSQLKAQGGLRILEAQKKLDDLFTNDEDIMTLYDYANSCQLGPSNLWSKSFFQKLDTYGSKSENVYKGSKMVKKMDIADKVINDLCRRYKITEIISWDIVKTLTADANKVLLNAYLTGDGTVRSYFGSKLTWGSLTVNEALPAFEKMAKAAFDIWKYMVKLYNDMGESIVVVATAYTDGKDLTSVIQANLISWKKIEQARKDWNDPSGSLYSAARDYFCVTMSHFWQMKEHRKQGVASKNSILVLHKYVVAPAFLCDGGSLTGFNPIYYRPNAAGREEMDDWIDNYFAGMHVYFRIIRSTAWALGIKSSQEVYDKGIGVAGVELEYKDLDLNTDAFKFTDEYITRVTKEKKDGKYKLTTNKVKNENKKDPEVKKERKSSETTDVDPELSEIEGSLKSKSDPKGKEKLKESPDGSKKGKTPEKKLEDSYVYDNISVVPKTFRGLTPDVNSILEFENWIGNKKVAANWAAVINQKPEDEKEKEAQLLLLRRPFLGSEDADILMMIKLNGIAIRERVKNMKSLDPDAIKSTAFTTKLPPSLLSLFREFVTLNFIESGGDGEEILANLFKPMPSFEMPESSLSVYPLYIIEAFPEKVVKNSTLTPDDSSE